MKTLRVLHVLGQLNPSGAEMMLRTAMPHFKTAGVEVTVLSTGAERGPFSPMLEAAGCEVRHLPFKRSPRHFWQVFEMMREPAFDALHLHTEQGNFYYGLAALATRKRAVRTVHSVFRFEGWLRRRRAAQRRALQALGLPHVAVGESVLQNERERFGLRPLLVKNWYDDRSFKPATLEQRRVARQKLDVAVDSPVIVTVGNCAEIKNHKSLLRALAMLPEDARPLYLHAGTEDEECSERLLCNELGLDATRDVRFLGPVSEVDRLLMACDIFVMPSLYEGFGIAAVEALGSGLPTLFADVPGLRDFAREFPRIVYCETSPHALAQGLLKVIQAVASSATTQQAVERSLIAQRLYGAERGVRAYIDLYR